MKPSSLLLLLLLGLTVSVTYATSDSCVAHADCPGYDPDAFCSNAVCLDSTCVDFRHDCPGHCDEAQKRCAECLDDTHCPDGTPCNVLSGRCEGCASDFDCPEDPWCEGGRWSCNPRSHRCQPNSPPCKGSETCRENTQTCSPSRPCRSDAGCNIMIAGRTGAFCPLEGEQVCDEESGLCIARPPACRPGQICDNDSQSCRECVADSDCTLLDASRPTFCQPPTVCAAETGRCIPSSHPTPCNRDESHRIEDCDEASRSCVMRACTHNDDCDDGNDCNGREMCLSNKCLRPHHKSRTCPGGETCSPDGTTCVPIDGERAAIGCAEEEECEVGLVCREHKCLPCRDNSECSDGVIENGEEICNASTGRCEANPDPCGDGSGRSLTPNGACVVAVTQDSTATKPEANSVVVSSITPVNVLIIIGLIGLIIVGILVVYVMFYDRKKKKKKKRKNRKRR